MMANVVKPQRSQKSSRRYREFQNSEHIHKKRTPHKADTGHAIIYVSTASNVKNLLEKCDKLIRSDENEIIIYCMGAAVERGILLALQLCEKHVAFKHSVNTSTVELVDDLEPTTDEGDYEILKRNTSALKIRVFRSST